MRPMLQCYKMVTNPVTFHSVASMYHIQIRQDRITMKMLTWLRLKPDGQCEEIYRDNQYLPPYLMQKCNVQVVVRGKNCSYLLIFISD